MIVELIACIMIVDSKSKTKFVQKNFMSIKTKLLNKKSDAETHFKELLTKANIYFVREKCNYKKNTRWCYYDFYIPILEVYIEIDGTSHNSDEQKKIDKEKEQIVRARQKYLIRFTNDEVLSMDEITLENIIDKVVPTMRTKRHPHRNYKDIFYQRMNFRINQSIEDMKPNCLFDIDESKEVYLYDHFSGNYFCFKNVFYAKINTQLSINEIFSLLEEFDYKPCSNRRFVFGWTLEECENNVAKVYY